jgi:tRNA-Thr(GGU) m(6)t(6)A37 methyltransferase TsaA
MANARITLDPIATVQTCFGGKFGVPRQPGLCPSAWGRLVFHEAYRSPEAIRGMDGFSHLWLIFGFHETADQGWKPTVRPPRLGGNQRVGVFASRSTFRPNGLGLSLVRLEGIDTTAADAPVLLLGGVDLLDGTPVYDIKPYLPYAESIPDASAGFAGDEIPRLQVEVADEAARAFADMPQRAQAVIREALALDPRPAVLTDDPDRVFGALLCGRDVRFSITEGVCRIVEIDGAVASDSRSHPQLP